MLGCHYSRCCNSIIIIIGSQDKCLNPLKINTKSIENFIFFIGLRVLFGKDFGARRHEKSMQLEVEHEQKTLKSL